MPFNPEESRRIANSLYRRWYLRHTKLEPNCPLGYRTFVAIDLPTEEAFERENRKSILKPEWSIQDILDREG
jgi:hypothetical protein